MGKLSRTKGKVFERQIAKDLREALGLTHDTVKRGLQSRFGGGEVPDVMVDGLPIHWECKHSNSCSPAAALRQAADDVSTRNALELPVVVLKRDRAASVVWMYADDLRRFLNAHSTRHGLLAHIDATLAGLRPVLGSPPVSLAWSDFLMLLAPVARDTIPAHV